MKTLKIGDLLAKVPIVQGGMGVGISLSGLASAVANAGGVGVISSAGLGLIYNHLSKNLSEASILGLKEELRKAREKTRGIVGVNIMVALTNFADLVKTAIAEKADIIFAGAGLPLNLPSFLKSDSTTKLAPIVSSARALKAICRRWIGEYGYVPTQWVGRVPRLVVTSATHTSRLMTRISHWRRSFPRLWLRHVSWSSSTASISL